LEFAMQRLTPMLSSAVRATAGHNTTRHDQVTRLVPDRFHPTMSFLSRSASRVHVASTSNNIGTITVSGFALSGALARPASPGVNDSTSSGRQQQQTQRGRSSMKRMATLAASAVLVLFAGVGQLAAQNASAPSELVISVENITARAEVVAGKRLASAVKAVVPGDVVEYRLVFTNTKKTAVLNVVFQDPIPAGLQFVAGTANSTRPDAAVEYSIDRAATWSAQPLMDVVENGKTVKKPAAPEQYTTVRWRVDGPVAPGATVEARFRTRAVAGTPSGTSPAKETK
jgi:uncharacterized repeat protein (TIGR01451 family)